MTKIRECIQADIDVMFDIINDAAIAYKGHIPDDCWHEPYMPLEHLEEEIGAGIRFFGYEEDGELLGIMGIQDVKGITLFRHAYVRTAHRNRGIGGQLIQHLMMIATRPVMIGTWKTASWAIKFYEDHGFVLVDEATKNKLLKKYWTIPVRQIETSVVLVQAGSKYLKK